MSATVPGYRPINKSDLVFVGARDIDPSEAKRLESDHIPVVGIDSWRKNPATALELVASVGRTVCAAYLHFDMDVLEPFPVRVNEYHSMKGGPRHDEVGSLLRDISERIPLRAAGVTAWDPSLDPDKIMREVHACAIECLADLGTRH